MNGLVKKSLYAGASALSLMAWSPASAQDEPAAASAQPAAPDVKLDKAASQVTPSQGAASDDIVVTARKREERLLDVPISLSAASGAQLASAGVANTADLGKISPGFTYQESQYGAPVFGLRGVSYFDQSTASSPAVSVYVDQVPLPLSILTAGALLDVERVEVLKGPQGTLFGQNSTGGAVNYIAAKPTKEFAAGLQATYGRFNRIELSGYASGPLSDTLGVRVAVRAEDSDDFQRSLTRADTAGQRSFWQGRVILDWQPTDNVRFELNANAWVDNSDSQIQQFAGYFPQFTDGRNPGATAGLLAQPIAPRDNRYGDFDMGFNLKRDNELKQVSLRADLDITSNITLTSLSSYIKFDGFIPTDPDGSAFKNIRVTIFSDFKIFNQELRLAGDMASVRWMIGGNYEHARLNEKLFAEYNGTNTVLAPVPGASFNELNSFNNQKTVTKSGFGSIDWDIMPALTVQASARYTDQKRDFNGCTADTGKGDTAGAFGFLSTLLRSLAPGFNGQPTVIAPGSCVTLGDDFLPVSNFVTDLNENNTSFRAGISYKPSADSLLYANVTKGYKAGSFSPTAFIRTTQIPRVQRESVLAYEAGFKTRLAGIAELTGAAFYYDYRNKQITGFVDVFPLGNLPASVNVPKSSIKGAELGVVLRPLTGLRISAAGTYIDSQVEDSYVTATPLGALKDIKGEQLPNAPKWQLNGDAEYRFPIGTGTEAYLGGNISYRSAAYALFGQEKLFRLPGYALIDLRAGVEFGGGRWRAEVFGRNITDKYYLTNVSRSIDAVTRIGGMPATYGVTLGFRY